MFTRMKEIRLPDRQQAGRLLAERLEQHTDAEPLVVGLPRGGVVVGAEISRRLGCPLDVLVAERIWAPWHPNIALGSAALGGVVLFEPYYISRYHLNAEDQERLASDVLAKVERRTIRLRATPSLPEARGRTVILVDDGLAHGTTVLCAIRALRKANPSAIVLALGLSHPDVTARALPEVDEVVGLVDAPPVGGRHYLFQMFDAISDDDVAQHLVDAALHFEAVKARRAAVPRGFAPATRPRKRSAKRRRPAHAFTKALKRRLGTA